MVEQVLKIECLVKLFGVSPVEVGRQLKPMFVERKIESMIDQIGRLELFKAEHAINQDEAIYVNSLEANSLYNSRSLL